MLEIKVFSQNYLYEKDEGFLDILMLRIPEIREIEDFLKENEYEIKRELISGNFIYSQYKNQDGREVILKIPYGNIPIEKRRTIKYSHKDGNIMYVKRSISFKRLEYILRYEKGNPDVFSFLKENFSK